MNKGSEQWIDEVMQSTREMQRAEAPEEMLNRIRQRISRESIEEIRISKFQLSWLAAAVILLVGMNVWLVALHSQQEKIAMHSSYDKEYGFSSGDIIKP